ncbi:hypothetical protein CO731_04939 [Aminobacter sp. MSH1]|uniref:hypothetical protein n=1 Tax=Aminobacter sp. MSH1 TaxID=374606 RepID=UPI000D50522B|nr:hypothetical protein [Aminobacter sp. MSH1]AWC25442.1 hypothetical protein CO731_04939 [Aminobacter sp. MSH1]
MSVPFDERFDFRQPRCFHRHGTGEVMDWLAIGTLGAAIVAAGAAVWAALVSHRQLRLSAHASQPELPVVAATIQAVEDEPDWSLVVLEMRNRAPISIDLLTVAIENPQSIGLLNYEAAHGSAPNDFNERTLMSPLPTAQTKRTVAATTSMGRAGYQSQHSPGELAIANVYAHCKPSRFAEERAPRLRLEMRWRDHTTKTFAMAVNIIKPNTA